MPRKLKIVVSAQTADAERALQQTEDKLQAVEKQAEKTGKAVESVEDAAKKTSPALGAMNSALGTAAKEFAKLGTAGMAGAVAAPLIAAGKAATDFATNVERGAKKARLSLDSFQGLDFVARKNQLSFDKLANAMDDLDIKLTKGSKGTVGALEAIGLATDDLLGLARDDRFRLIATKIAGIEDPAKQTTVAFDLMGEAGKDLIPVFEDIARGAEREAPKVSDAWIKAGAAVGSAWELAALKAETYGKKALLYLTMGPSVLNNKMIDWSEAVWGITGELPGLRRDPERGAHNPNALREFISGLQPKAFDPLHGQSMAFVERQLTPATPRSGGGLASVLPFVAPWMSGEQAGRAILQAQMFNGVGFSGFTGGFGATGFPGWAPQAPLGATQNLNFAGFAPTVGMNAPTVGGKSWLSSLGGMFGSSYSGGWKNAMGGIASGLSGALGILTSGGGQPGAKQQAIGSAIGGIAGGFLGPVGSMLGSFIGGKIGGKFYKEGMKTNDTRDSFIQDNFGSVDALREAADKAGFSVDKLLSVGKVKDFEAEVRKLTKALEDSEADARRTDEAMQRWGLTITDMGPKFQQTKINDAFKEATEDLRVLSAAGADFNILAEKMGPHFGGLIQEAIEMGGTVPKELEPILKKMMDLGVLTDKNGDKFTELAQIPFAADLNKDFQTLISKMDALIDRLEALPGLFNDAKDAAGDFAAGSTYAPGWMGSPGESGPSAPTPDAGMAMDFSGATVVVSAGLSRKQAAIAIGEGFVSHAERRGAQFAAA